MSHHKENTSACTLEAYHFDDCILQWLCYISNLCSKQKQVITGRQRRTHFSATPDCNYSQKQAGKSQIPLVLCVLRTYQTVLPPLFKDFPLKIQQGIRLFSHSSLMPFFPNVAS